MRRSGAKCASGSFFGGSCGESTAPGAALAAWAGVGISFAGRSAVLRRGRSGPALLREAPKDAVAVPSLAATAACLATWADGLLFGDDGVLAAVLPHDRDASLAAATATTVSASIKDSAFSRRIPRVVRRSREAAALPCLDVPCRPSK